MSKKTPAGPSASADVAGATNTNTDTTAAGASPGDVIDTNQAGDQASLGNAAGDGAADQNTDVEALKEVPAGILEWASSLEYPVITTLRNNGHITVVEPETAQIIGGGSAVSVTLIDEGHAVRVLDNTVQLNALHFQGDLKVRLDAAPDELYLKG